MKEGSLGKSVANQEEWATFDTDGLSPTDEKERIGWSRGGAAELVAEALLRAQQDLIWALLRDSMDYQSSRTYCGEAAYHKLSILLPTRLFDSNFLGDDRERFCSALVFPRHTKRISLLLGMLPCFCTIVNARSVFPCFRTVVLSRSFSLSLVDLRSNDRLA